MPLILKVLSYKDRSPEKLLSASFDQRGETLGRSMNNPFVLHEEEKVFSGNTRKSDSSPVLILLPIPAQTALTSATGT